MFKSSLVSDQPGVSDVVRQMGMSERTLQRRIKDEGSALATYCPKHAEIWVVIS